MWTMSKSAIEMTEEEINREVRRMATRSRLVSFNTYDAVCRQCDKVVVLTPQQFERYENNKGAGHGFTQPKCSECWT